MDCHQTGCGYYTNKKGSSCKDCINIHVEDCGKYIGCKVSDGKCEFDINIVIEDITQSPAITGSLNLADVGGKAGPVIVTPMVGVTQTNGSIWFSVCSESVRQCRPKLE